jgi:hypothetical protein
VDFGFDEEGLILLKHPRDLHLESVGVDSGHGAPREGSAFIVGIRRGSIAKWRGGLVCL